MIRVECRPDYVLVKTLTRLPKRHIIHHQGKPEICKLLKKSKNCKGLIDEDPGSPQPKYLTNLASLEGTSAVDLKVLVDENRNNLIIVLCPKLEDWIIKSATLSHIDLPRQYNLPNDGGRLHRTINHRLPNFQRLLEALHGHSRRLAALEKYLKDSN